MLDVFQTTPSRVPIHSPELIFLSCPVTRLGAGGIEDSPTGSRSRYRSIDTSARLIRFQKHCAIDGPSLGPFLRVLASEPRSSCPRRVFARGALPCSDTILAPRRTSPIHSS